MNYLIGTVVVLALFCNACTSTDKTSNIEQNLQDSLNHEALKDSAGYTSIEWLDSTSQNLPAITAGQTIEISWKFRNTGNKPLIIADVVPSCGCTTGYKPEKPIEPGKEDVIKAIYKSDHPGSQTKTVSVRSNTRNNNAGDQTELRFSVNVKPGS